ncbi:MAG: P-loop NTPase, partial [Caldilineaceae bacterium]|nr:P-loop NTPase [Caldilineaceae bacterium]
GDKVTSIGSVTQSPFHLAVLSSSNPEFLMQLPFPLKKRIHSVTNLIAVASGKGGVGKTTTAVNLALALQQQGAKVGLYDADLYGPNVPLMLGIRRKKSAASIHPSGMIPTARVNNAPYIPPIARYGLQIMSVGLLMATDDAVMPDPRMAGHIIRQTLQDVMWGNLDFLLLDLPPGTGEPQQTLLEAFQLDGVVLVTTPQDLSLMDAGRSLKFFQQFKAPILGVVENMSYLICPHCGEQIEVFQRSPGESFLQQQNVELLGRIPMHIEISRGISTGHPLMDGASDAGHTQAFQQIAQKIMHKME